MNIGHSALHDVAKTKADALSRFTVTMPLWTHGCVWQPALPLTSCLASSTYFETYAMSILHNLAGRVPGLRRQRTNPDCPPQGH